MNKTGVRVDEVLDNIDKLACVEEIYCLLQEVVGLVEHCTMELFEIINKKLTFGVHAADGGLLEGVRELRELEHKHQDLLQEALEEARERVAVHVDRLVVVQRRQLGHKVLGDEQVVNELKQIIGQVFHL